MSYQKYREYRDSEVPWLGSIPSHWRLMRSDNLIRTSMKTITQEELERRIVFYYSIPSIQEIGDGYYEQGDNIQSSKLIIREPQVLVSKLNPRKGTVCIAEPKQQLTVCSGEFIQLIPKNIKLKFLLYAVKSENYKARLESSVASVTRSHQRVDPEDVRKFWWPFPDLQEQKKITDFLDHETARIDALIEEQQRLIELLQEKRQAVISHAVTKGLDPDVPMKDSGVGWLGRVPAHWTRTRLKHVSPFMTVGIVVNPSSYVADEGLPYIYGGEIKQGFVNVSKARRISSLDSSKNWKTRLEEGDLVTVRVGAPGLTAVVPKECEGGNCASVMLIKNGRFDSRWLCSVMNSRVIRHQIEMVEYGAAQKQFNISDAIEFWLYEPPRDEQAQIADFVEVESQRFDILMSEADKMVSLLQERRSALISAAVTGKIDVRNWQPWDEAEQPGYAMAAEETASYGVSP